MSELESLNRIAEKLRKAGATLPAPAPEGTIEGAMNVGLCISLMLVEEEIELMSQRM